MTKTQDLEQHDLSLCIACRRNMVKNCSFCDQCDDCCDCPERKLLGKVEELVRQADSKLLSEIYKALTHTETFEYRGYKKRVRVDIICDGTVKWFVKGKRYDGKEVVATFDNVTLDEVLYSEIGGELNLIRSEVIRGLGWDNMGTFYGSPPHVYPTYLQIHHPMT